MKNIFEIIGAVVLGFVIIVHLIKIAYLLFKIPSLKKIPAFSNRNLSDRQLILYYLITIVALLGFLYSRFELGVFE